ncbi:MAG: ABC transporter ATP-binding protein [Neisseriaceae bacterium]
MSGLILEHISVVYKEKCVLQDITVTFNSGEKWAIYGPNGAGKSTLLKAIMGLIPYQQGEVKLENITMSRLVYLPQLIELNFAQPLSVFELVALGLWHEIATFKGINLKQRARVEEALDQVGLIGLKNRPIEGLSSGQLQRALFARALVQEADYFLLDEPFTAVDEETIQRWLALFNVLQSEGKTIIAVIHDNSLIRNHFSQVLVLEQSVKYLGPTVSMPSYLG